MASRSIPYVDNVEVLRSIEKKIPGLVEYYEVRENLKKNFVFHESCHAVARGRLTGDDRALKKMNLLLEESYANTCELFGALEAEDSAHRIFYEANSFTALFEMRGNLKKLCNDVGAPLVFQFVMLGYLHSNFLFNSFSEKEFEKVSIYLAKINNTAISPLHLKALRVLLKVCFTLDLNFRTTTTGLHLKLSGVPDSSLVGDFSYFDTICNNGFYHRALKQLTDTALGEKYESK